MFASDQNYPELYMNVQEDHQLVINALPSLRKDIVVPLGFKTEVDGSFIIKASDFEGINYTTKIFLEDLYLDKIINLRQVESYTFTSGPVYDAERFVIHFNPINAPFDDLTDGTSSNSSSTQSNLIQKIIVSIYANQDYVYVKCNDPDNLHAQISIVNMLGQELLRKDLHHTSLNKIQFKGNNSTYLVRILSNEFYISKKVFIE
jgi:hypothetical protein